MTTQTEESQDISSRQDNLVTMMVIFLCLLLCSTIFALVQWAKASVWWVGLAIFLGILAFFLLITAGSNSD